MTTFLYVRLEIGDVELTVEREIQLLNCVKGSSGLIDDAIYLPYSPMTETPAPPIIDRTAMKAEIAQRLREEEPHA
jgi:hypothetical protein